MSTGRTTPQQTQTGIFSEFSNSKYSLPSSGKGLVHLWFFQVRKCRLCRITTTKATATTTLTCNNGFPQSQQCLDQLQKQTGVDKQTLEGINKSMTHNKELDKAMMQPFIDAAKKFMLGQYPQYYRMKMPSGTSSLYYAAAGGHGPQQGGGATILR